MPLALVRVGGELRGTGETDVKFVGVK